MAKPKGGDDWRQAVLSSEADPRSEWSQFQERFLIFLLGKVLCLWFLLLSLVQVCLSTPKTRSCGDKCDLFEDIKKVTVCGWLLVAFKCDCEHTFRKL